MMENNKEKKHDSVLMGWTDDPVLYEGEVSRWSARLHESNIKDIQENYLNEKGYVRIEMFRSKNGKSYLRVQDPNSESVKEYKAKKQAEVASEKSDDLPF